MATFQRNNFSGVVNAAREEWCSNKLIQRWLMYDMAESREKEGKCVWGRTGLRWLYFMRVKGSASSKFPCGNSTSSILSVLCYFHLSMIFYFDLKWI